MLQALNDSVAATSETLLWVLAHSLWQATLIGIGVQFVLRYLPARCAELRYRIAGGGLLMVVLSVFVTWSMLRLEVPRPASNQDRPRAAVESIRHPSFAVELAETHPTGDPRPDVQHSEVPIDSSKRMERGFAMWLTGAWMVIATTMLLRGLMGHAMVRTWPSAAPITGTFDLAPLELIVKEFAERLRLRNAISLIVCERVSIPAVIGIVWPTILVPPAMMFGVPIEQWRIIIAHELAHVQRWDAFAGLAQMVVESLLFFNPAVWWISRQIQIEREACCDALAAQLCGRPLFVARVLVDVASIVQAVRQPASALSSRSMLGFADPAPRESELSDRVQRLVEPDRAPQVKVSWGSLLGLLMAIVLFAAVLQRGTDLAVKAAARLMTPKERVDTLAQLELETKGILVPPADDPVPAGGDRVSTDGRLSTNGQDVKVPVEVRVRFDDGGSIGSQLRLSCLSHNGNWSSSRALDTSGESQFEFRKTFDFVPSRLRIVASYEGWASVASPVVSVIPGNRDNVIELVLTKGRSVQVVVRNQDGEPISGALTRLQFKVKIGGATSSDGAGPFEYEADAQGRLHFEHIGLGDYDIQVQASGYQRFELGHSFVSNPLWYTTGDPFVITMQRARPAVVRVLDAETNQPLSRARFVLVRSRRNDRELANGFSSHEYQPNRWHDFGETGEDGVARLIELCDDTVYSFVVLREGYGLAAVELRAGEQDYAIKLGPPIRIAGHVAGPLDRLRRIPRYGRQIRVIGVQRVFAHVNQNVDVEVNDAGSYSIDDVVQNEQLTFALPDETRRIIVSKSTSTLDFDVKPVVAEPLLPMRDVIIRLTGTAADAPARGSLYVTWQHPNVPKTNSDIGPFILRNNEIRLRVAVGAKLRYWAADLVGYRIDEQTDLQILPGDDPQIFLASTRPDGGIFASILRQDGTPAEGAIMTTFAIQLPPNENGSRIIQPSGASSGALFLSRVPLGGRYRVCAREIRDSSCVWAVSDEVTIDETCPIRRVTVPLPKGRDWRMRVLEPMGEPIAGQPVQLEISLGFKDSSTVFSLASVTTADGYVTFRGLSLDQPTTPITVRLTAIAPPEKFAGAMIFNVDPDRPIEMHLKRGVAASGLLVDSVTGKPIPGAEVQVHPADRHQAEYKQTMTTRTDNRGHFRFDQLEPIRYRGQVKDAAAKGAVIEVQPTGGYRIRYPNGATELELRGGEPGTARWEVVLHPDGSLRLGE